MVSPMALLHAAVLVCTSAKTVLNVASVDNGDMIRMKSHLSDFYAKNPDLEVVFNFADENIVRNNILKDITTNGGKYDVMVIGMYEVPIFAKKGWLLPLEDMPASFKADDLIPAVKDALTYEKKLYASPFYGESSFIMYRKDIILDMPDQPTWGEVYNYAKKYHKRKDLCADPKTCDGKEPEFNGICLRGKAGWGENGAFLTTLVNTFGGRWFDENWVPQLDGPEWKAAISFYVNLMQSFGPKGAFNFGFSENLINFQQGKCLMWIDATVAASWLTESPPWGFAEGAPCFGKSAKELTEDDGSLKCTPMWKKIEKCGFVKAPSGQWRKGGWLWSWNIGIPAGSKKLAESRKFVDWATNQDYIELVANATGRRSVPPGTRVSTYANKEYQKIDFAPKTLAAMQLADPTMETGTMKPKPYIGVQFAAIPEFQKIGTIVGQQLSLALEGKKSVEDALSSSQASTTMIMSRAGYLKKTVAKLEGVSKTTTWGRTVFAKRGISSTLWSSSLTAADLDNDGKTDLLAAGDTKTWLGYFKNLGSDKGFSTTVTPLVGNCVTGQEQKCAFGANSAILIDGNIIYTAADPGNSRYTVGLIKKGTNEPVVLSQNVLMSLSKVVAADIDSDGSKDIIVAGESVAWLKNEGNGKFGTLTVISTYGANDIVATDIDGDGDIDVVGATTAGPGDSPRWKGVVFLLENDGTGKFTQSVINDSILQASGVASIPRSDGKGADIVSTSTEDSTVAIYHNTSSSGWTMKRLTHARCGESDLKLNAPEVMALCPHHASGVFSFDADGDGDMDIAVASRNDNSVSWFENQGGGNFSDIRRLDTNARRVSSVVALDADGDGAIDDLASASEYSINWYSNYLTPAPHHDKMFVGQEIASLGLALWAINMVISVFFIFWTITNRNVIVVRYGQPVFLVLICVGCMISSSTILPLVIDDSTSSGSVDGMEAVFIPDNADKQKGLFPQVVYKGYEISNDNTLVNSARSLSANCMTMIWLYSAGFVVSFGALFAKLYRVNKVFNTFSKAKQNLKRIKVSVAGLMVPIAILLVVDCAILLAWQVTSPLVWRRDILQYNTFGQPLKSFGHCSTSLAATPGVIHKPKDFNGGTRVAGTEKGKSAPVSAWTFFSPVIVLHLFVLMFGNFLAYKSRKVDTRFQEAKYIAVCMVSNLQVMVIAFPVLYIVNENPSATVFIRSFVIFLNDLGILLFIFLPKFFASRNLFGFGMEESDGATRVTVGTSGTTRGTAGTGRSGSSSNVLSQVRSARNAIQPVP